MLPINVDGLIKTIADLRVDTTYAGKPLDELATKFETLDQKIKKAQTSLTAINQGMGKQGSAISSVTQQTVAQTVATQAQASATTVAATATKTQTVATKQLGEAMQKNSVLGSQLERRIGWFFSGAMWYGGIRAMKAAVTEFQNVETSMVIIERVANDATFSLEKVRKELIDVGKEYGHTWDSVQEVAIRWTQAGYSINDVIELTRISLLGLNVAEMDLNMATQGLISIMSQWDYTARDLETVIDKLNITSDNYAVTTGDLVEGLLRSSGAARALGLSFEETVGLITATRVASGRLGAEVGNALNTLLAYLTRQSTLNKMMEAGINVFADAAGTTLRPALDILNEVVERWQDNAESMPMAMVEIADEMGVMSEEMAEIIGLTDEWTQLQKLELEQSMAGVRRRNFLIALMRNFAMAQEVVNGMTESHGYSMEQNAKAMETLEKKYNQLKIAATELAVSIGDAGVMGQLKRATDKTRGAVEWFNSLDNTVKTAVISFIELTVALKLVNSLLAMGGVSTAGGIIGTLSALKSVPAALMGIFGGPWGLLATGAGVALMTVVNNAKKYNAELEVSAKNSKELSIEIETLKNRYVELAEKVDRTEAETEEFTNITNALTNLLPHAITGFDEMGNAISNVATITETATQKTRELKAEYESFVKAQAAVAKARIPGLEKELELIEGQYEKLAEMTRLGAPFARGALMTDKSMESKGIMERLNAALRGEAGAIAQWKAHFADDSEVMKMAEDKLNSFRNQMETTRQEIAEYEAALKVVEELGKIPEPTADGGGKLSPGFPDPKKTDEVKKAISKLSDVLTKYVETAMRAADVQGMLNDETQRTIDGYRAKIDYLTRDNASSWERAEALRLEADLTEKLREKQEGVHQEANFLREALAKLEQYQKGVNVETEEGWESYKKLESQIESIKSTIGKLGIEWFNLAKAQEETIVQTKIMQDALKDLDFYARLGITTVEEQLAKTRSIYGEISSIRAMTVAEDYDMIQRQHSAYKQMLLDMKRDAEDAYKERIKLIEKETEATIENYRERINALEESTKRAIALIQEQIDALDEEDTADRREEERRKHEERVNELLDKRRYHELRTGREHSEAIVDIDKQLAEEQRKWEQRQAEWVREDKKKDLRKQIEDIRENAEEQKSIYNEQIEDARKRADEQKEMWQEAYERMQKDFSDHSISMIALAATFDPGFWEDAKHKGELWVKGFKDGTAGFGDYLYDLTPQASSIVESARSERDATYRHIDEEPTPEPKFPSSYTIEEWGHTYTVADGGHNIYKNGRWIPAEDFKYLPDSVLQLSRDMKAGKAHTGAMTASAGIAELIPGEMIFPPNLSAQLERLIGVLTARPLSPSIAQEQWRSGSSGGRVSIAGNLLNVEKAMFEDETDMEIFAREINRQLANLGN